MYAAKDMCVRWLQSLATYDNEQCLVVSPLGRKLDGSWDILQTCSAFGDFSTVKLREMAARIRAENPGANVQVPPGRVGLLLCHNNYALSHLEHANIPGRYNKSDNFRNSFMANFRSIAHLRDAAFADSDSPIFCMTYAQGTKLLQSINVNLIVRKGKGEDVSNAKLAFATHVIMLDAWIPTVDLALFMHSYDTLGSYGCAMPRIVHISQGTPIGDPRHVYNALVETSPQKKFTIACTQLINASGDVVGDRFSTMIENAINAIVVLASSKTIHNIGYVYLIVPDTKTASTIIRKAQDSIANYGWKFYERGVEGFAIKIFTVDRVAEEELVMPEAIMILPVVRTTNGYEYMTNSRIGSIIRLTGTYFNTIGRPLLVSVPYDTFTSVQTYEIDPFDPEIFPPVNHRKLCDNFVVNLPVDVKIRMVCQLANSSMQCGRHLRPVLELASEKGLISCYGIENDATISHITNRGVVACRGETSLEIVEIINKWKMLHYGRFPIYCLCAILERYINHQGSMISEGSERITLIAKEMKIDDPLVFQLSLLSDYVEAFGLEIVSKEMAEHLCKKYGANVGILLNTMSRVLALRANFEGSQVYGRFDPLQMVKIVQQNNLFKIAHFKSSRDNDMSYAIDDDTMQYIMPIDNPFVRPTKIIILHSTVQRKHGWTSNGIPTSEIGLYSVIC